MRKHPVGWNKLNRSIRAACSSRNIDKPSRLAIVGRETRKGSMRDCSVSEMSKILKAINNLPQANNKHGFKATGTRSPFRKSGKPYIRLLWALWGDLKKRGGLRATDTNAALLATVNRHLKRRQLDDVRQFDWLTYAEARPVIEELKSRIARLNK